jgi:hypothetical protein
VAAHVHGIAGLVPGVVFQWAMGVPFLVLPLSHHFGLREFEFIVEVLTLRKLRLVKVDGSLKLFF